MTPVILCGGSGTRLWPLSRTQMPKQFVPLFDGTSLFQLTLERNRHLGERSIVVSNAEQYFLALDQMPAAQRDQAQFLLEPMGRNTAPAIALAALAVPADEILLVLPSDHLIRDQQAYQRALTRAAELAAQGSLVTFGIAPSAPETGYGYIQAEGETVRSFREKPDLPTAQTYLQQGNYLWNSGMFCFRADAILQALQQYAPDMLAACRAAHEQIQPDGTLQRIPHAAMASIPAQSIDYAVMEQATNVRVVPCDIGWTDLGSFESLSDQLPRDDQGNSRSTALHLESRNNLIIAGQRQIATIGVDDLMIVDTPDALLVARKGSGQQVKQIVAQLDATGSQLPRLHRTSHRPWGTYTVLEEGPGYKIKRIQVEPGRSLSLQKHYHRNEHWIVVSGTAQVRVGDDEFLVRPNESTYIRMGDVHRLQNPGTIALVMIEVQTGSYLGEDDIVRMDDRYGRE